MLALQLGESSARGRQHTLGSSHPRQAPQLGESSARGCLALPLLLPFSSPLLSCLRLLPPPAPLAPQLALPASPGAPVRGVLSPRQPGRLPLPPSFPLLALPAPPYAAVLRCMLASDALAVEEIYGMLFSLRCMLAS